MRTQCSQERLWKQAAAVRLCQEAVRFDRSKLKKVQTKVLPFVGKVDKEMGAIIVDGKPDFPHAYLQQQQQPLQQHRGRPKKEKGT